MSDPFIGEIRMFGGNFAPRGFAKCDGQLLAISQNNALFALLGTTYGGDGETTFGLPDLRGRLPIHLGQGPGLSNRTIGQKAGAETATSVASPMPVHGHAVQGTTNPGDSNNPAGKGPAVAPVFAYSDQAPDSTNAQFAGNAIIPEGAGAQAHPNVMPFQVICFIIALTGIFPSRN